MWTVAAFLWETVSGFNTTGSWPVKPISVDSVTGRPNSPYWFSPGMSAEHFNVELCGNNPYGGGTMMLDPELALMSAVHRAFSDGSKQNLFALLDLDLIEKGVVPEWIFCRDDAKKVWQSSFGEVNFGRWKQWRMDTHTGI